MGCSDSRSGLSKEEGAIVEMEEELNYHVNNCKAVDFYIRKYSFNGEINPEQWRDIVRHLDLKVENTAQNPKVVDFYSSFKGREGRLPLKPMLVLGVWLSDGPSEEKARLLFEAQDVRNTKNLTKADIHELVDLMVDIAIEKLPTLIVTDPQRSQEEIGNYVSLLNQRIDKAKDFIAKRFIGKEAKEDETVTLAAFLKNFEEEENKIFLTPNGLRLFIWRIKPIEIKSLKTFEERKKETEKQETKDKSPSSSSSSSSDEEKKNKKAEQVEKPAEVPQPEVVPA